MRHFTAICIALLFASFLTACGQPVPPEKAAYVGEWQNKSMYLLITEDGSVSYQRLKNGGNVSVDGPLKEFTDEGFEVGIGPMSTTFVVNQAPFQQDGEWHMMVDDVLLIKTAD